MGEDNPLSDSRRTNAKDERPRSTRAFVLSRLRHPHHFRYRLPGRGSKNEGHERRGGLLPSQADRPAGATPCRLFAGCTQRNKATFSRELAAQRSYCTRVNALPADRAFSSEVDTSSRKGSGKKQRTRAR